MADQGGPSEKYQRGLGVFLLISGVLLVLGWIVAIAVSWENVVSSHIRLGYLIGDVGLVAPLCWVGGAALRSGRPWAPGLVLFTLGAFAYDIVHFTIYLIQEQFLGIPMVVYLLFLAAILACLVWMTRNELVAAPARR